MTRAFPHCAALGLLLACGSEPAAVPATSPLTTIHLLSDQIQIDVPAASEAAHADPRMVAPEGALSTETITIEAGVLEIDVRDLPCVATPDLAAAAHAEIARRFPSSAAGLTVRELAVEGADLRAVELVPSPPPDAPDGGHAVAWRLVDVGSHVVMFAVRSNGDPDGARSRGEAILSTLRRGSRRFVPRTTSVGAFTVTAPEGWVSRQRHGRSRALPLRPLGRPARARISIRTGPCPAADGPARETPLGPWTLADGRLCRLENGSAWMVSGTDEAAREEALTIALSAAPFVE